MDRIALDRTGADDRHLHDQIVETARLRLPERLLLRARFDLEEPDGVHLADHVEHTLVVERQSVEVGSLSGFAPVDTIGAGDSFDAGVLAGLLNGYDVPRSLALGCSCGALSTRAVGGTAAQPTLDEALDAIRSATEARQLG